jgi:hypothetical protein
MADIGFPPFRSSWCSVERGLHAVTAPRWRAVAALGAGLVAAGTITNHERCEAAYDGIPVVCLGVDSWFDSSG